MSLPQILLKIARTAAFVIVFFLFFSCKTTKYVPEGSYLLNKVKISGDYGHATNDAMLNYVRQRPNVRVLGFWRLNLDVYNLSKPKDNRFNNWLRSIGSAPVIYDSLLQKRSREQLQMYLKSLGYFDAVVSDTMIVTGRKKCTVQYNVEANRLYRISDIGHFVADESIRDLVLADTVNSLLQAGDAFDSNVHDDERQRIARTMNENGYYNFTKDYIYFIADSSRRHYYVADSLIVMKAPQDSVFGDRHVKSVVDKVFFVVSREGMTATEIGAVGTDSLEYEGFKIYYRDRLIFRPQLLTNSCFVKQNSVYCLSDVELTQARFNSLKLFSSVGVRFYEVPDSLSDDEFHHLNCYITLQTSNIQSYSLEIEGTNSSGNLGGALNVRYTHANLFRGAELLNVKYRLASQNQFARDGKEHFYTFETGVEAALTFPKFLSPFFSERFIKRHNPSTSITASYDYQRRPDFTKSVVASKIQYNWRQRSLLTYSFVPVEFNIVNIPSISYSFHEYIRNTYLQYSYTDHFIMSTGFSAVFNQMKAKTSDNAWYVYFNIETAGNVLNLLTRNQQSDDEFKRLWGIRFAQYFKTNIELRYQISDIWQNNFAYRLYAGVGVPYGNSRMLPFEKSFFVGGANSIRAWPVRGLGPGSSQSDSRLRYHNQTSDIRLEANVEYRYRLVGALEGALFADAGNIWALSRTSDKKEAIFGSEFYKQIALGGGLGIRLNFDYFVLRVDAAVKLHYPAAEERHRWVIAEDRFRASHINYNFAIGYPF